MKQPKILVVGSLNMDLSFYHVPHQPKRGETVIASEYQYSLGGKGANQAYASALQGADVTLIGRVGDDENGRTLRTAFDEAGIDTSYIKTDPDEQTGFASMTVDATGEYGCFVVLGANATLSPGDVEDAFLNHAFDMVLMQLEIPLETVYQTHALAQKYETPVFLDAGPAMKLDLERLKGLYILSPNEAETRTLTGMTLDDDDSILNASAYLFEQTNPEYVVLKLGERGAYIYDGTKGYLSPAYDVEAVDSTGAGDTFSATLANQLCSGKTIKEATQYANAAAAICITQRGAQSSMPTIKEIETFLKQQSLK